jgi:hypothetical protein
MDRLVDAVQAEARECGHRVLYISRIPANQPAPSADVRRYISQLVPTLAEAISSGHIVLEGEGFAAALKRGVLTGFFQLLGSRRTTFVVHSVASDVPRGLESALAQVVHQLLEVAKAQGLLDAPGPFMTLPNAIANDVGSGFARATAKVAAIGAQRRPRAP